MITIYLSYTRARLEEEEQQVQPTGKRLEIFEEYIPGVSLTWACLECHFLAFCAHRSLCLLDFHLKHKSQARSPRPQEDNVGKKNIGGTKFWYTVALLLIAEKSPQDQPQYLRHTRQVHRQRFGLSGFLSHR